MAKKPKITRVSIKGRYVSKVDLAPISKLYPGWWRSRPDTQGLRDNIAAMQSSERPYPSGADVVRSLESFGNKIVALLDLISDDRQRKALKKHVSDFYTDEVNRSNSRVEHEINIVPLLKNTEEANS